MKHKKNKKKSYNKQQFKEIVCSQCQYCEQTKTFSPALFCYEFKHHLFVRYILPKLRGSNSEYVIKNFENIFCKVCDNKDNSGVYGTCKDTEVCIFLFKEQTGEIAVKGRDLKLSSFTTIRRNTAHKKQEKPVRKTINIAYPTFFHNNNEEWATKLKNIINEMDTNGCECKQ